VDFLRRWSQTSELGAGPFIRWLGVRSSEIILERAEEEYPDAKPRIIPDNGPQFIARDFKEFIRIRKLHWTGRPPCLENPCPAGAEN